MIGQTISHYKIIEKLGQGGMGEVYLAQDLKLERNVAVKFLPAQMTRDTDSVERFRREAKAAAALNHPNIVTIHEIIETDGQICIVMEQVQGQTLRDLMTASGQLPIAGVITITEQIASGLHIAHKAGIIHRDIKPENIIINKEGQVKILDFGLAKLKGAGNLTKENSTLGTIHYMSPEQTKGEDVDHRSDIWSLGVVIYEMTTGRTPFKGNYEQAIMYSILNEEVSDLDNLPGGIGSIIKKCLNKNPDGRYQNIEELAQDAKRKDAGNAPTAKKRSESRHKKTYLWIAISALLVTIIAVIFIFNFLPSGTEEKPQWINSIAVLPFDDLSVEKNQDYFCIGMTEQILSNLTKLSDLKVIARTSVMKYKNTQKSISEIASELNVNNILAGSIQRSGDKVRINVQLINASNGSYLWSDKYDSNLKDLFSLQDQVSQKVADAMHFRLRLGDSERTAGYESINMEAYEFCLKGEHISRYFLLTQPMSKHYELFYLAEHHFKKSLQLDPNYIRAKLSLAEHYLSYTFLHGDESLLNIAKKYTDEVITSYADNDLAIALKGGYYYETGDIESSFAYFKQALQLNPNQGKANYYISQFLKEKGLYYQARNHLERAVQIDPLNTRYLFDCGLLIQDLGLFEQAKKYYYKLYEIDPDHVLGRFILFWNNLYSGNMEEAKKYYTEHMQMFPDFDLNEIMEASYFAALGEREKSLAKGVSSAFNYLLMGMKEEAIKSLIDDINKQDEGKSVYLILLHFPLYDRIRDDMRFKEILAQQKIIYEDNLKKYIDSEFN
jgi:eukaryotic-like serine/threonine-protein kinase